MKKLAFLLIMLVAAISCNAESRDVHMKYHRRGNSGTQTGVHRAPMRMLDILNVEYDEENRMLYISADNDVEGEVFLLDAYGAVVDYSPTLNVQFDVSEGINIIRVESNGWYAEGEIY